MRILFLEEDFKTGQFSFTPQQVPLKTRKKQNMAIKHSRKKQYVHQSVPRNRLRNVIYYPFSSNMHYSNDQHIMKTGILEINYKMD